MYRKISRFQISSLLSLFKISLIEDVNVIETWLIIFKKFTQAKN